MTDRLAEIMDSLYDWHHNDNNKIVAPNCILPECIKERIRYFLPQMDNGLTFKGCMEYVLATQENEKKLSEDYENYSYDDWLPVSDKVEEWHKSYYGLQERYAWPQVAVAMLYGYGEENYQVKYGNYYFNNRYLLVSDPADYTHFSKEGAERAAHLLNPEYVIKNVRFWNSNQGTISRKYIKADTQIPQKYISPDYVFLFQVGKQAVGMNGEKVKLDLPDCVRFDEAVQILQSIKNIKPKIIRAKQSKESNLAGNN